MVARDVYVPGQLQKQLLQEHGREPMGAGHIRHFGDQLVQRANGMLAAAHLRSGAMDKELKSSNKRLKRAVKTGARRN